MKDPLDLPTTIVRRMYSQNRMLFSQRFLQTLKEAIDAMYEERGVSPVLWGEEYDEEDTASFHQDISREFTNEDLLTLISRLKLDGQDMLREAKESFFLEKIGVNEYRRLIGRGQGLEETSYRVYAFFVDHTLSREEREDLDLKILYLIEACCTFIKEKYHTEEEFKKHFAIHDYYHYILLEQVDLIIDGEKKEKAKKMIDEVAQLFFPVPGSHQ